MSQYRSAVKPLIRAVGSVILTFLIFVIFIPKIYNAIYYSSHIAFFTAIGQPQYVIPVVALLVLMFLRNLTYMLKITYFFSALSVFTLVPITYALLSAGIFDTSITVGSYQISMHLTFFPVLVVMMAAEALMAVSKIIRLIEISVNLSTQL